MIPSFKGLSPASEASSRVKRANRSRDTTTELALRRELFSMGFRYRKNVPHLPGKPDLAFIGARVAVFCDGDFWHGRSWPVRSAKLGQGANASYWLAKIARNIERDAENTVELQRQGWCVIRLWETDIQRDPHQAACQVRDAVRACRAIVTDSDVDVRPAVVGAHAIH